MYSRVRVRFSQMLRLSCNRCEGKLSKSDEDKVLVIAIKVSLPDVKRPLRSDRESRSKWQPSCLYGGVKQEGLQSPLQTSQI